MSLQNTFYTQNMPLNLTNTNGFSIYTLFFLKCILLYVCFSPLRIIDWIDYPSASHSVTVFTDFRFKQPDRGGQFVSAVFPSRPGEDEEQQPKHHEIIHYQTAASAKSFVTMVTPQGTHCCVYLFFVGKKCVRLLSYSSQWVVCCTSSFCKATVSQTVFIMRVRVS